MALNAPVFVGNYNAANNAALANFKVGSTHTATSYINGIDILDPVAGDGFRSGAGGETSGIILYVNLTAYGNGTDTLTVALQEQDPTSGTWNTVATTLANATTLGLIKLKLKPAVTAVAASTTAVTVQDTMPYTWRIALTHSGASTFTYSVGATLYA